MWYNPIAVKVLKNLLAGGIIIEFFQQPDGKKGGAMKMQELRAIARRWGVDVRVGRTKQAIIRDSQVKEGYSPCFRTKELCEEECLWKPDCLNNQSP